MSAPRPEPARCRSCSASIYWCLTAAGKRIPVDAAPVATGNLVLVRRLADPDALPYDESLHAGWPRWVSHFATCVHAAQHRKSR